MTTIDLDSILLKSSVSYCRAEFKNILTVLEEESIDRYGPSEESTKDKAGKVKDIILKYSALVLSINKRLDSVLSFSEKWGKELTHIVSSYFASEIMLEKTSTREETRERKLNAQREPDFRGIEYDTHDFRLMDATIRAYKDYTKYGSKKSAPEVDANFFFYCLSEELSRKIQTEKGIFVDEVKGLTIKGPGFEVKGSEFGKYKKRTSKQSDTTSSVTEVEFQDDVGTIILTPDRYVHREDIVGNEAAVSKLENAVRKLMTYIPEQKANPFLDGRRKRGFNQGLLLLGDTGTGKTLVSTYGMSLARKISMEASRHGINKEVRLAKLNIESSYQEGGVLKLRSQLEQISKGDAIYYVFMDELDTVFTSRGGDSGNSHYHKQKLGELMRFLDGEYPNYGNYLFVATVNDPNNVDRALKNSRLDRVVCPGPQTPEDMIKILALNFGGDITNGTISIDKEGWKRIGLAAAEYGFNGRNLRDIASDCYEIAMDLTHRDYGAIMLSNSIEDARQITRRAMKPINAELILEKMQERAMKDQTEVYAQQKFDQKRGYR